MTIVPPPSPQELAEEYRRARLRIDGLLRHADEAAVGGLVVAACPAWTVHDLAAHLAGVPADLVAQRRPSGDTQAWVDAQIADRAGRSIPEVLDEWAAVSPAFEELIVAVPAGYGTLTYDVVVHEHDLRATLGQPGERDSAGVRVALSVTQRLLTADLAKHGLGAVAFSTGDDEWVAGEGEPQLRLRAEPFEALRLLGSRRSVSQLRAAAWEGDLEAFLPALGHMPYPEHDLVE